MAYELSQDQDEEENGQPQGPQAQSGGSLVGGGGSGAATTLASGAEAPASPHTNVKQYLDANDRQAQQLAGKIGTKINDQNTQVRGNIGTAKSGFDQKVNENTIHLNQNLVDQAKTQAPTFVQDNNNVSQFKTMRDATYKGPQDLMDYGAYADLQAQSKNAMDHGALVGTDAGRQTLIGEVSKRPTAGNLALNNILLSQNQNAMGTLNSANDNVKTLQSYLDQVNSQARDYGTQGKATTAATKQGIQDQFKGESGLMTTLQKTQAQKLADQRAQATALTQNATNAIKNKDYGSLKDETAQALGLNQAQLKELSDKSNRLGELGGSFDLGQYLTAKNADAELSLDNITSRDEQAQAQALASLFDEGSWLPTSDKAGTGSTDLIDYNQKDAITQLNSLLKNAELSNLSKSLGDQYYSQIGQHTGQGWAPAFNGRDVNGLVTGILNENRDMSGEEMERFFNYGDEFNGAKDDFITKLLAGRSRYNSI